MDSPCNFLFSKLALLQLMKTRIKSNYGITGDNDFRNFENVNNVDQLTLMAFPLGI